jgi:phosphoribosylformylglycinamidine cyclo-ligase
VASQDDPTGSAPTYAEAGVDLDHDEGFVSEIREITRSTLRPEVLSSVGGFAGLFKAPERYDNPVFVAGADGVGTKLKLAAELGRYDTVGIDCVAMVVNDLVVQGAEPIVFLDYVAMSKMELPIAKEALRGIAEGCRRAGCALLGGETATMPGVYPEGEIELVGFGVGVAERDNLIDGSSISQGDAILGLASSGFHSNGYSLVRRIVDQGVRAGKLDLRGENAELNTSLAGALLAPTRIYVKPILNVMRDFTIRGMAHITGGGFPGNIPRVLPKGVRARPHRPRFVAPARALRTDPARGRDRRRRDAPCVQLWHRHGAHRARRPGLRHPGPHAGRWRAGLQDRRDRGEGSRRGGPAARPPLLLGCAPRGEARAPPCNELRSPARLLESLP